MKLDILLASMLIAAAATADAAKIKAKWFEADISPDVGALLAGYGANDVSVAKYDDLLASGLCLDDGTNRILVVSLDLIGLDYDSIKRIRRMLSGIAGAPEEGVLVSCTHTHQGPHTRMYNKNAALNGEKVFNESRDSMDVQYMERLYKRLEEAAREMMQKPWGEYTIGYHSSQCRENRNRTFLPQQKVAETFLP